MARQKLLKDKQFLEELRARLEDLKAKAPPQRWA